MFYRLFRAIVSLALRLFYRVDIAGSTLGAEGPIIYVGNHPNGLVDPGMVMMLSPRPITFLAKAPLFRVPIIALLLRALGALPVYRRQDDPSQMGKNEGTLEAAAEALRDGRAITLFPEGKSHSEPQLAELKTGAARIALRAANAGAPVRIIPIGLTYAEKHRFRSEARIDIGAPLAVEPGDSEQAARALTARIADALRSLTLNLERWEDLPVLETAEALYGLRQREHAKDPERLRAFARGMSLLRDEQPARYHRLHREVLSFQRRLALLSSDPRDLAIEYRPSTVTRFVARNLAALLFGLPLFLAGMALFTLPYQVPWLAARAFRAEKDVEATVKVLVALVLSPLWVALLAAAAWALFGGAAALATLVVAPPLALFTRYFHERRSAALADAKTFFLLGSRKALKARLSSEAERLASELDAVVAELRPRVAG